MNLQTKFFIFKIKMIRLKRKIKGLFRVAMPAFVVLAMLLFGLALPVNKASAALQAAGPIGASIPFPTYFQDTTGLALQPCLGINPDGTGLADPNCVVLGDQTFNSALAVSFPNNFPQEFFYYIADANTTTIGPAQKNVAFRLALEGSTLGALTPANLLTFLRINFRISKPEQLVASSTYTFTHPFGTFTCTTDALGSIAECHDPNGAGGGGAQAFRVEDVAGPPITAATIITAMLPAPNTGFGHFLKAVSPVPPAGYIGNPNITQTIQAGSNGAAFVMSGPSVGGVGVNTVTINDWFLAGKIATIDTVPPVIGTTSPASVTIGSTNVPVNVNISDNLFVGPVTIDLGPLGNALTASLNGANAGTASAGTGNGSFTIDTNLNTLAFNINVSGLTSAETAAHIHGPLGTPAFTLPLGASKSGVWNYPEALEADILAGNTHVEIHTVLLPAVEIEGPILPAPNIQTMTRLSGTQAAGIWGVVIPSVSRGGTFNLPITVSDGSNPVTGAMTLAVVSPLASVSVTPATASIAVGATRQLSALPVDIDGAPFVGGTTIWSSNNINVASVSATGLVSGVATGIAVITASVTGAGATVSNTATITVTPTPILTGVSVIPSPATINVLPATPAGVILQLTANPIDQLGAPFSGATINWTSSNPAVATVSATGLVTSVTPGITTITASASVGINPPVIGTSVITVATGPTLTTINVTPASSTLVTGGTQQLVSATLDQNGAPIAATLNWISSNPAVATVGSTTGLVTAVSAGTANVTATSGGVTSNVSTITVVTPVLTSMAISPAAPSVTVGASLQLAASGANQFGGAMTLTGTTTWSSNNGAVGSVSITGLFTALTPGNTVVSATNGSTTASVTITVNAAPSGGGGGGGGPSYVPVISTPTSTLKIATTTKQNEDKPKAEDNQQVLGEKIEAPADRGPELKGIRDPKLEEKLKGRILLQVESKGQSWYLDPIKKQRVFLGRPADAFRIMREHGLGIRNSDLTKIPMAGKNQPVTTLARQLSGRIVLQVEANGEAYYINPLTFNRHFLGRPADAFRIMRELALGISNNDLAKITTADDSSSGEVAKAGGTKTFSISAKRFNFTPGEITVNRGDKVVIKLASTDAEHGIKIDQFGINKAVKAGETAEIQFVADKSGTFEFRCPVPCGEGHSEMKGKLIVI